MEPIFLVFFFIYIYAISCLYCFEFLHNSIHTPNQMPPHMQHCYRISLYQCELHLTSHELGHSQMIPALGIIFSCNKFVNSIILNYLILIAVCSYPNK